MTDPLTPDAGPVPAVEPAPEDLLTDAGLTDAGLRDDQIDAGAPPEPARPADPSAGPIAGSREGAPIATVVIVNYNGAHLLEACLDALAQQDMPRDSFRVVVVDNASADPSRDLIREQYPDVELVISHQNRGFAGGNNLALA